jgi:hypothetical protein
MGGARNKHGAIKNAYKILVGKLKAKNHSEDLDVYGRIILKWILKKQRVEWRNLAQDHSRLVGNKHHF